MAEQSSLDEFYEEFFQEIVTTSNAEQIYKEEALFDIFTDYLIDAGEFDDAIYAHYQPSRGGIRIDGYCGDPLEDTIAREANSATLGVIVLDLGVEHEIQTRTRTEIDAAFKRAVNFVDKSRSQKFRDGLEESSPGYELAGLINERWSIVSRVKVYLLTNKVLSAQAKGKSDTDLDGREVTYSVWDISRLHRLVSSGREREALVVDFEELPSGPLSALRASAKTGKNEVYLAAVPGLDLATIYDQWGTRLLEQNVRVFLQARSKVNKGIKGTLENTPEMFFSFNNGLTATAEKVETVDTDEGAKIVRLDNFQIVNGGQTTASIYAAYKSGVDLSKVYVQMKLSVVSPDEAKELVPMISRSANSQNRVSDADFFSNHPYHIRIEDFSRRIYAPPQHGSYIETKWYYERARGQYRDEQAYLTPSKKKKFAEVYPKPQSFTKTDLAKYLMVWTDDAYYVNRGAQKNFAQFAKQITLEWEKNQLQFNEFYYRRLIAKKIIYNVTEKIVTEREWYEQGGYRASHVVLTLGLLSHAVKQMGKAVNFEAIWTAQEIDKPFRRAIGQAADAAHEVLMSPQAGYKNITEWAKQEKCLTELHKRKIDWDSEWLSTLLDLSDEREAKAEAKKDQRELNGIEAQELVIGMGPEFWSNVLKWSVANGEGTEREQGIMRVTTKMGRGSIPTDKQSVVLVKMMDRFKHLGCPYKLKRNRRIRS